MALFNGVRKREVIGIVPEMSDYKIGLTRTVDLDIPKGVESAENYCATLAHKACHSFSYNSVFDSIEHPRYVESRTSDGPYSNEM